MFPEKNKNKNTGQLGLSCKNRLCYLCVLDFNNVEKAKQCGNWTINGRCMTGLFKLGYGTIKQELIGPWPDYSAWSCRAWNIWWISVEQLVIIRTLTRGGRELVKKSNGGCCFFLAVGSIISGSYSCCFPGPTGP